MEKILNLILTELQSLKEGQSRMENRIGNLEVEVKEINASQLRLETRIENEVVDKIRALFDDRQVHLDYFASICNSQAKVEEGIETLRRRTINHEIKIQDQERELRLLRTERL